jgi:chemotaxis protein histidine kinase CheA
LRSQLDAHDPRLPGTGMFDLKTRAVVGVRMALEEYEEGSGYQIRGRHGEWESFEREYYDMIRAAFLKYSLQVRMGRMDGIFVAFHNTERVFGFQYISLPEMDYAIHGTEDITLGDSEFKLSLELLNRVLDRATSKFPEKTLRLHFETRDAPTPFMYIFAEPIEEEEVDKIQATNKAKIEEFESRVLGLVNDDMSDERRQAEWESLRAEVEQSMERDEVEPEDAEGEREDSELETISAEEQREIDELLSSTASEEPEEDEEDDEVIEEEAEEDKVMDEVIEEEVEEDDEEIADENSDENSDELEETHESADEDGLEEQQIGIDEEKEKEIDAMEEDNAPGAEEESNVEEAEELGSEDSESDSAEQVELVENEDLVPDESAESNVIDEDTENPKASQSDAESGEAVQQPIWDGEVKETKSRRRKASGGDHDTVTISGEDNVLAMTLTIRNKVNGRYVDRPNNINEKTDWLVEYALAEVPSSQQANKLYAAAKLRREQVLTKAKDKGQDDRNNIFIENIKKLSRKGREWLKRQEKLEADLPVKTLDDPTGGKKSGVWAGQKQEKE